MTESADLLTAIAAAPADDLPRLVFADWLDDRGEPAYAQFIRDQIRLAQVPQWDPLAVRARHQLKDSLGIGRPFFGALPQLPIFLKWHPEKAFRRGFGSGVVVHQLSGLLEAGPQLFDLAPVEELWLSAATLDEWRQFAKSPWLKNVRKLHFHFSQGLHEPIRCLAESKYAHNIDEIWFDTLETPAAGLVIEALAQSPLAMQLKGLHLRLVHTPSLLDVVAALAEGKFKQLKRFSIVQAGVDFFNGLEVHNLLRSDYFRELEAIDISHSAVYANDITITLNMLKKLNSFVSRLGFFWFFTPDHDLVLDWCNYIKFVDISEVTSANDYFQKAWDCISTSSSITSLRANKCRLKPFRIKQLFTSSICNSISELDLGNNTITKTVVKTILAIPVPTNLTSLVISRSQIAKEIVKQLESHFGDRLVWAADDAPTGLAQ